MHYLTESPEQLYREGPVLTVSLFVKERVSTAQGYSVDWRLSMHKNWNLLVLCKDGENSSRCGKQT